MHPAALSLAVVFVAGIGPCQDPEPHTPPPWTVDQVAEHFASADTAEVAWAAWFVRRDRLRALVPAVRRALARLGGNDGLESQLARLQLLDALIEVDVRVPGEELLPHAISYLQVPALVLAAKCPQQNFTYFQARMQDKDSFAEFEWQVCGNLLAAQTAPGFATFCLQQLVLPLAVTVRDDKAPPTRQTGSGG